jgi:predicted transcriptional regulator
MIPLLCHKKQHLGRIMNRVLNCFQQAAKEVMANEGEPAKALKEATEETSHENDQTKVSQESVQNGVMHTSVEEDANEPGKVVKEINTVASTVAV